jgi:hypothetical protein
MKHIPKVWIAIGLVIFFGLITVMAGIFYSYWRVDHMFDPDITVRMVVSPSDSTQRIYLTRKVASGFGDSHLTILLSCGPRPTADYDSLADYVYDDLNGIFYRLSADTLHVFTMSQSPVPRAFSSKITVAQHQLENPDFQRLIDSYSTLGLLRYGYLDD